MTWRAVVVALDAHEGFRSRLSAYQHPLAGRPVLWHVIAALLEVQPPPASVHVLHRAGEPVTLLDLPDIVSTEAVEPGREARAVRTALRAPSPTLLVDGAAALLTAATLGRLVEMAADGVVMVPGEASTDVALAVAGDAAVLGGSEDALRPAAALRVAPDSPAEALRVVDRHALSAAAAVMRDRVVRRHEARGVTFLLPETVLVDVGVRIGADTVIYPQVVLEGATVIGGECVIGPFSRLTDANIGRGVELTGWNYVCRANVRNHAVLEPYVRRGYE